MEIKPCPFCGKIPHIWEDAIKYVRCETEVCPASTMHRWGVTLKDWNTRYGEKINGRD